MRGENWKAYLQWEILSAEVLGDDAPDIRSLAAAYRRLRANHQGLEMPVFGRVRRALRRTIYHANLRRQDQPAESYARQLERLAAELDAYQSRPDELTAFQIGRRLGLIEDLGHSPQLAQTVRQQLSHPNLRVHVAAPMITAASARPVSRVQPVSDYILGTSISGTANTSATVQARPVASMDRARIDLVLRGTALSNTIGVNGPVCIYANGCTEYSASRAVYLTREGLAAGSASADASTRSNIRSIRSRRQGIGSRLIERVAWKRAGQQKGQAERIASAHAEQRIATEFTRESLDQLSQGQRDFEQQLKLPLLRRDEYPEYLRTWSTSDGIGLEILQASTAQIGAPTVAPPIDEETDLALRVHESYFNNLAAGMLGGYKLRDAELKERVLEVRGELPPQMQKEQEPWAITFEETRPIVVRFDDQQWSVTIRGRRYEFGDRIFGEMNITAVYSIDTTDEGVVFRRQGDVEILPPDFDKEQDSLSAPQTALRGILTKRLADVFQAEIKPTGLELPGELKRLGRLALSEISSDDGWFGVGWKLP